MAPEPRMYQWPRTHLVGPTLRSSSCDWLSGPERSRLLGTLGCTSDSASPKRTGRTSLVDGDASDEGTAVRGIVAGSCQRGRLAAPRQVCLCHLSARCAEPDSCNV